MKKIKTLHDYLDKEIKEKHPTKNKKDVFNPENIQPGDYVYLQDDSVDQKHQNIGKVISVEGPYKNKVFCAEVGHQLYAHCLKKVKNVRPRTVKQLNQRLIANFKSGLTVALVALKSAEIADTYNSTSNYKYSLGDCILLKLNYIDKRHVRKNPFYKE